MTQGPRMVLSGIVLESPDARELAGFYQRLLGWEVEQDEPGLPAHPKPQVSRCSASLKLTARTDGELSRTTPMSAPGPRCASNSRQ